MSGEDSNSEFEIKNNTPVYKLKPNWDSLLKLLPRLQTSATVYRGYHSIHCQHGGFPKMPLVDKYALHCSGESGISLGLDHWGEAWWYYEKRLGQMLPCLEIADENGRGLFKVCYKEAHTAKEDFEFIKPLIEHETDSWGILHLKKSNMMDCFTCQRLQKRPPFLDALRAMQRECLAKQGRLGLILAHEGLSTWDSLHPLETDPSCCWLGFGFRGNYINIEPAGYRRAEVITSGSRGIVTFFQEDDFPALSLVEPEGLNLKSLRRLGRKLSSSS